MGNRSSLTVKTTNFTFIHTLAVKYANVTLVSQCSSGECDTYIHTSLFAQKFPISHQNTKEQSWTKRSFRRWHSLI